MATVVDWTETVLITGAITEFEDTFLVNEEDPGIADIELRTRVEGKRGGWVDIDVAGREGAVC